MGNIFWGLCVFMEERKLLWVALLLALFILVVSGTVFYVYSPSKSQSYTSDEDLTILQEISNFSAKTKVDPDMWSRQKDTVPDFQMEELDSAHEKKITVVDGSSENANEKKYIDVSGLNSDENTVTERKKMPEEVAKELRIDSSVGKKQTIKEDEIQRKKDTKIVTERHEPKIEKKTTTVSKTSTSKNNQKIIEKRNVANAVETVYWVQTASLTSRLNAEKAREKLVSRHMKVEIFTKETTAGLTHRVRVGPFKNNTEAEYWLKNIKEIKGFERSYISQERIRA